MDSDGESMSGDELSPEVEQFLAPRPAAPLGESVLSSAVAGVVASFAALVVLLAWQQSGLGDFLLPREEHHQRRKRSNHTCHSG